MKKGFTLIELMIVIAIIAIIAAIAIPGLLAAQRASNERNASASLKTLSTAEADFRSNDRDGNLVNDFWTADVFALYGLIPPTGGSTTLPSDTGTATSIIKLIEPSVAGADAASLSGSYGNLSFSASIISGSPKAGYAYRMFASQDDGPGLTTLRTDTDGASAFYGTTHDRNRFAVMAAPETLSAGKLLFIVNADNTIWKYNLPATYIMTFTAIAGSTDSTSAITGTGQSTTLDAAAGFPASPGSIGCSKMD
jgi:prepilin-type N-terminal cleavage/methylation domain-containing protein